MKDMLRRVVGASVVAALLGSSSLNAQQGKNQKGAFSGALGSILSTPHGSWSSASLSNGLAPGQQPFVLAIKGSGFSLTPALSPAARGQVPPISTVPEPATMGLIGIGLIGLAVAGLWKRVRR
ncbi:MAG: PEP-CTERM sorting domain-containing protein [Gemmatimonadota bacterium]